jgi:hypothetical protein
MTIRITGDGVIDADNFDVDASGNITSPTTTSLSSSVSTIQNVVKSDRVSIPSSASNPSNPQEGDMYLNTTLQTTFVYANGGWRTAARAFGLGEDPSLPGEFAKDIKADGQSADGLYWMTMGGSMTAYQNYALMDNTYDGGGWSLLGSLNDGNGFASGSNYFFSLNVNASTPSITANHMIDRRNTFTPGSGDEFMIRREDNNDWVRFVVTTWSPTANSVANGWETTNDTTGQNRSHPYWALGQMYNSSGSAVSGVIHFNGCALGGNCNSGGGDGAAFGTLIDWSAGYAPNRAWGGAFNAQSNGGSPLYWDQTQIQGTRLTYWYRPA